MTRYVRGTIATAVLAILSSGALLAQTTQAPPPQTEPEGHNLVAVSGVAVLSSKSNGGTNGGASGTGVEDTPTASAGVNLAFQHFFAKHSAIQLNYGYTRNTQVFFDGTNTYRQAGTVHELTLAYVYSIPLEHATPFVFAGGGGLLFNPNLKSNDNIIDAGSQYQGAGLVGFGIDTKLLTHLGMRIQYRALIYKAPDFAVDFISTGKTALISEPSFGLTYRF